MTGSDGKYCFTCRWHQYPCCYRYAPKNSNDSGPMVLLMQVCGEWEQNQNLDKILRLFTLLDMSEMKIKLNRRSAPSEKMCAQMGGFYNIRKRTIDASPLPQSPCVK